MEDDQLREQFARWARPLRESRPPAVTVLRRRGRKRTARRAAVASLAAAAAVAGIVLSGFQRPGLVAAPATIDGAPPYAVLLEHGGASAAVLDMGTGKSPGRVAPPVARTSFAWVAAAADDRTFVLADEGPGLVIRFYLLRLTAGGWPGPLTPLKAPALHGYQVYGIALTADASKLAVAWQLDPGTPVTAHLSVTTLATGATRTWSSPEGGNVANLSWAGDQSLAFYWTDGSGDQARWGLRLLDTAAAGTNLLRSRAVLPGTTGTPAFYGLGDSTLTADGSTVLSVRQNAASAAVVKYSAATGKLRAVLKPALPTDQQSPAYCGILWTDPGGRRIIFQCGSAQVSIDGGRYTRIRLPWSVPGPVVASANTFAW